MTLHLPSSIICGAVRVDITKAIYELPLCKNFPSIQTLRICATSQPFTLCNVLARTCLQGTNIGYFTSFTVFLALSDPEFCNTHIRSSPKEQGILPLSTYFTIWGWAYVLLAVGLMLLVKERYDGPHSFSYGLGFASQLSSRELAASLASNNSSAQDGEEKDRSVRGSGGQHLLSMPMNCW